MTLRQSTPCRRQYSRQSSAEESVAASGLKRPDELGKNSIVEKPAFGLGCESHRAGAFPCDVGERTH
jgi:hypothetical protein